MKVAEFYRELGRKDPPGMRGIKARFAIIAFLLLIAVVATPLLNIEFILPPVLFVISMEFVTNLICIFWMATGRGARQRIYLAAVVDLFLVTVVIHYIGGIETTLSWVYAIVLLAYASLYGMRVGLFAAAVSSLLYSSLLLAEFSNVVPHINFDIVNSSYLHGDRFYLNIKLVSENVLFFITAAVAGLLSERLIQSKNDLEQRNADILKMQKTLEGHMGNLERTVAERTQELTDANEQLRREIAERMQAEEALKESEERYRMLVEEAKDIICTIDMKTGILTSVNSFAANTLGYRPEAVVNKLSFLEMVHPEDHQNVIGRLQELASERKRSPNFPLRLRKADGTYMNVEVNGAVTYDAQGNPETFVGIIRDVTERHRAEKALRESEERYRTLVDNSLTGTCLIQDGKYRFVNKRLVEMTGYSLAELEEASLDLLVHPDDVKLAQEAIAKRISREDLTGHYQFRAVTKTGEILWIETLGTPVDYQGRPAVLVNLIDITERRRAEQHLRASEERYRTLLDSIEVAFYETDLAGNLLFFNDTVSKFLGYTKDELAGMSYRQYTDEENADIIYRAFNAIYETRLAEKSFECTLTSKDGKKIPVEYSVSLVYDDSGEPIGFRGLARDIAERKRAEEHLRASEEKYRTLLDSIDTGFYETDLAGNFLFFNETIRKDLEYSKEELAGMNYRQYTDEENGNIIYRAFNTVYRTGRVDKSFECTIRSKSGREMPVEFSVSLIRNDSGEPVGFRGLTREITERKRAEEKLKSSEERLKILFEFAPDAYYLTDFEGRFVDGNRAAEKLFGYSKDEFTGKSFAELNLLPPDRFSKALMHVAENAEGKATGPDELTLTRKDGVEVAVEITTFPVTIEDQPLMLGIARDVTERKHLERQFFQAQKMESIGTLAGGIAHDFNNLLGGILGYASFMKSRIEADHPFYRYVETIERTAMRAGELTSQLLGFARGGKYETKSIDLNSIVEETLRLIDRTFDRLIEIETHLCPSLPAIEGDAGQIQQALMNLCVNARDAMAGGGTLIIETNVEALSEEYVRTHMGAKEGSYVSLSVTDTGTGMDRETLQRIFEPFFTTKEQGKGTGLGLSMVYGVVKNHGGHVRVYSEPGEGTTFKLYLPCSRMPEAQELSELQSPPEGNELILVVDDEESIRSVARETLEAHGYRVLLAEDGAKAIEIYTELDGEIGLVILDMIMPKMGGRETFLKLKELNPNVKALLSTGYSQNGKAQEILDSGVMGFVQKPYQVDALLSGVRKVLDARVTSKTSSSQEEHSH